MSRQQAWRPRFRCAECGRTRNEDNVRRLTVSRLQGGNYRTPPRWGQSSICGECAEDLVDRAATAESEGRGRGSMLGMRWSRHDLERAVESLRKKEDE